MAGSANKRRKLEHDPATTEDRDPTTEEDEEITLKPSAKGLHRPISPPVPRRAKSISEHPPTPRTAGKKELPNNAQPPITIGSPLVAPSKDQSRAEEAQKSSLEQERFLSSPIQLTKIQDLESSQNVDAVDLDMILKDPMIKECWNFNYLHDIEFILQHLDDDVRSTVQLKIIHGFWRAEDERRIHLQEASAGYENVELIKAYMPSPFGTHHSKMLILIRHDDQAQVVIHTANMIARDWTNMTQAVWRSPLLPLLSKERRSSLGAQLENEIGSGERFKFDLLRYLDAYSRLSALTTQLRNYDFSSIRAAFIGSTPSRQRVELATPATQTSWGWLGLREVLSSIPIAKRPGAGVGDRDSSPKIVVQVSSIATLGKETWLKDLLSILSCSAASVAAAHGSSSKLPDATAFFAPRTSLRTDSQPASTSKVDHRIIFPTDEEIRNSLDGYESGHSIHVKIQNASQQKQLDYLRPMLCHWTYPDLSGPTLGETTPPRRKSERGPAAPHIKTYIRFNDASQSSIDWAMMTSANLSKQAWGEATNKNGEIWIQSWETGVVVWPSLFSSSGSSRITMIPVFGKDTPDAEDIHQGSQAEEAVHKEGDNSAHTNDNEAKVQYEGSGTFVGLRMPYDLPLKPYGSEDTPWCATATYDMPDWKGRTWTGYQAS